MKVYELVTKKLPPPHIIHANDFDTLLVACVLGKKFNVKIVYDCQELYSGLHTLPEWYKAIVRIQEFFLIRLVDKKIAVNEFIRRKLEKNYKIRIDEVILNCPPYCDITPVSDNGCNIRTMLNIPGDRPVYLYCGGLVKNRGIENTILSLKYLDDGILVVLGEGPFKEELMELIRKEDLDRRVRFLNFVGHKDVPQLISSATAGILPYENVGLNHYLCSPSKLFHYIMAELPIACSNFPFLSKVVINDGRRLGVFFDAHDPRSIATAIKQIISDPESYQQIKMNLREAKKIYNWENEEKKFMHIYNSLSE